MNSLSLLLESREMYTVNHENCVKCFKYVSSPYSVCVVCVRIVNAAVMSVTLAGKYAICCVWTKILS